MLHSITISFHRSLHSSSVSSLQRTKTWNILPSYLCVCHSPPLCLSRPSLSTTPPMFVFTMSLTSVSVTPCLCACHAPCLCVCHAPHLCLPHPPPLCLPRPPPLCLPRPPPLCLPHPSPLWCTAALPSVLACLGSHHRSPVCHQTALELLHAPPKGTGVREDGRMAGRLRRRSEGGWERGWEGRREEGGRKGGWEGGWMCKWERMGGWEGGGRVEDERVAGNLSL